MRVTWFVHMWHGAPFMTHVWFSDLQLSTAMHGDSFIHMFISRTYDYMNIWSYHKHMTILNIKCMLTQSCVWHDSFIHVTWQFFWLFFFWFSVVLTHSYVRHNSFLDFFLVFGSWTADSPAWCVTRRIYTCDMTHSPVWHDMSDGALLFNCWWQLNCKNTKNSWSRDLLICVTCIMHTCDMTRLYVWQVWWLARETCVTCLLEICMRHDMTIVRHVWHGCCVTCVTWLLWMLCDMW